MAALVDTNVLVYRHDPRFPAKQKIAHDLLRSGLETGDLVLAHQTILEFVAATTRPQVGAQPLLEPPEAREEAEKLLHLFPILYPTEDVVRSACRGAATYGLSWFDAHLWAYADCFGLSGLLSEDFEHGRIYGTVRITDPFGAGLAVNEGNQELEADSESSESNPGHTQTGKRG